MSNESIIILLLLITAHCLSDLVLRPANGSKSRNIHYFLLLHSGIHFGISLVLTFFMMSVSLLLTLFAVAASHYLIDLFKAKVLRVAIKNGQAVDIIDQIMHFTAIFLFVYYIH